MDRETRSVGQLEKRVEEIRASLEGLKKSTREGARAKEVTYKKDLRKAVVALEEAKKNQKTRTVEKNQGVALKNEVFERQVEEELAVE